VQELVDAGTPAKDLADQDRRIVDKFRTLGTARLGNERADALAAAVHGIDEPGALADVLRLACGTPGRA
jgi:hypothetical protein